MKLMWAKEGDYSTSFSHRMASGKKSKNLIGPLIRELGRSLGMIRKLYRRSLHLFQTCMGQQGFLNPLFKGLIGVLFLKGTRKIY